MIRGCLLTEKRVWDLMDDFEDLNIRSIPRRKNMMADTLTILASVLQPIERKKLK